MTKRNLTRDPVREAATRRRLASDAAMDSVELAIKILEQRWQRIRHLEAENQRLRARLAAMESAR